MRERVLTRKISPAEIIPFILFLGGYLLFCYPLSFAEYKGTRKITSVAETLRPGKGETPPQNEWESVKSFYFTIYYRPGANLKKIERKLRKRAPYFSVDQEPPSVTTDADMIAYRMDLLFRCAKDILGMRPRVKDLKIRIFKNRTEMKKEYRRIFGKTTKQISFYIYKNDTLYTNENDISDSVIAHEMGHVVVDHYFVAKPPERIREILSQYVDAHLED